MKHSVDQNQSGVQPLAPPLPCGVGARAVAIAHAARQQLSNLIHPKSRMEESEAHEILRENFFGTVAWQVAFHPDPGNIRPVPPIPASVTRELLESPCPIYSGELVKDSHILVLVPSEVDGQKLTPLRLAELCQGARVFDRLHSDENWETMPFASLNLSRSKWVLMPKGLDSSPLSNARGLFGKDIDAQNEVLAAQFPQYRDVTVVELFAAAALYCAINGKALFGMDYLRCNDESPKGGRICVGRFSQPGFRITTDDKASRDFTNVGRAISYRL